jgi:hypothetical protein
MIIVVDGEEMDGSQQQAGAGIAGDGAKFAKYAEPGSRLLSYIPVVVHLSFQR